MKKPHSTTVDDAPAPRPDPLWAMGGYSCTSVPQSILRDLISAPRHLSTANLPKFNAANEIDYTCAYHINEAFINLTYTYPVSNQRIEH
jgi:hypothetical protein